MITVIDNTKWRVIDSHWVCVSAKFISDNEEFLYKLDPSLSLADYLWLHGFDIPASITYCTAENERFSLKFRHSGGLIDIFIIQPLNFLKL